MKNAVGVLGGVGPLATVYFMEMIIEMTDASKDQEHIDMLVSNHATIPDRTGFILGESSESPMDAMVEDAQMLETAGCSFVVIPCNTAHYFFEDIKNRGENVIVIHKNIALCFVVSVILYLKNQNFFIFIFFTVYILNRGKQNRIAFSLIINLIQEFKFHIFSVFVCEGDNLNFLFVWCIHVHFVSHL